MNDEQVAEALNLLRRGLGCEMFSAHAVSRFQCYRHRKAGGDESIEVTILDAGANYDGTRYLAYAESENGRRASGNGGQTITEALATVHWYELDK